MGSAYPSLSDSEPLSMFVLAYQIFPGCCLELIWAGAKSMYYYTKVVWVSMCLAGKCYIKTIFLRNNKISSQQLPALYKRLIDKIKQN